MPPEPLEPAAPPPAHPVRRALSTLRFAAFVGVFYAVFFNLSVVRGNSMSPGIHDGDRILVEPWSYLLGGVERGDVVVLRYPLDPSVDYIKRVIGLPGDLVTLAGGHVWVNGELLVEPYIADQDRDSYLSARVRDGHVFVLGDNRPRSSDSREFGQVPDDYVRGRVEVRLWPLERVGLVR
jgi:signal peptidase I